MRCVNRVDAALPLGLGIALTGSLTRPQKMSDNCRDDPRSTDIMVPGGVDRLIA